MTSGIELVGRDQELVELGEFLDADPAPGALLLEGEPGIGKTTLWRLGVAAAKERGYRVLSCSPAEPEAELAYAALADLLEGVVEEVERALPAPQRRALRIALLLEDVHGAEPDRRAVAVALLGALRALASRSRLLIAIDDVQWLDASSADALRFAARRGVATISVLRSSRRRVRARRICSCRPIGSGASPSAR